MPKNFSTPFTRRAALAASLKTAGVLAVADALRSPAVAAEPEPKSEGPQRWMVIGAHPDDEAKTSALLLRQRKPDDELTIMIMRLCGEGRPYDRQSWTREEAIATRSHEMEEAAAFLKAKLRWWTPPHPANVNIACTPETVAKMVGILQEVRPTRIIANWPEDSHPDHVGTGETAREAVKQLKTPGGMPVYWFGTPGRAKSQPNFVPNHFVDISDPDVLISVLWSRFVHRSQAEFAALRWHLRYYRDHGQKFGTEYAAGYVLQHL